MVLNLLDQQRTLLQEKLDGLHSEARSLSPAYRFMSLIIDALKQHVSLQDEWLTFLEIAGLPEPEFKSEYLCTHIRTYDGH